MPIPIWSPEADEDLLNIWVSIAEANVDAADYLFEQIEKHGKLLAEFPGIGSPRPELGVGIRSFAVTRYLIFYRPAPDGIQVLRVLHGARDIPSFFHKK